MLDADPDPGWERDWKAYLAFQWQHWPLSSRTTQDIKQLKATRPKCKISIICSVFNGPVWGLMCCSHPLCFFLWPIFKTNPLILASVWALTSRYVEGRLALLGSPKLRWRSDLRSSSRRRSSDCQTVCLFALWNKLRKTDTNRVSEELPPHPRQLNVCQNVRMNSLKCVTVHAHGLLRKCTSHYSAKLKLQTHIN